MKNIDKSILIILITLFAVTTAEAQNSTASPYSMFGVGVLSQREDVTAAGLGHTGVALAPSKWVNISNPAGINNLDSITFYFNLQLKAFYANLNNGSYSQSVYSGNLDGLTMAFRATHWWTVALGYTPYSSVGYTMDSEKLIIGTNTLYTTTHKGSGGLSQGYINNAFTFFKHISLGISTSALWGSIWKKETAKFADALGGEDIYNDKKYTMNNLYFEYGLQFDFNIKKANIRFGGTFNEKTNLRSSYDHIVSNNISSELFFDDVTPLKGEFSVPRSYAGGVSINRPRFLFTADFRYNEWSNVKNVKFRETVKFRDNWSTGCGIEYKMNGAMDDYFFKRLALRLGYFYEKNYLKMRGAVLDKYGVTAGVTIPLGHWNNAIVVSYEYLKNGSTFNGMVEEKYNNFKIALNIRETWFLKSKFE